MQPQYIFETSWEVCNRVGGIYAVLSTRAASMQAEHKDKVIFFGPDFGDHSNLTFKESKALLKGWRPKGVRGNTCVSPGVSSLKIQKLLCSWTRRGREDGILFHSGPQELNEAQPHW